MDVLYAEDPENKSRADDREQGIGSRCQSAFTPLRQGCVEDGVPQPRVDGWPGANLDLNAS